MAESGACEPIERESFVYTSRTRTSKTTTTMTTSTTTATATKTTPASPSSRRDRRGCGGGAGGSSLISAESRRRFRDSSLPRSAELSGGASAPAPPPSPWSWFRSALGDAQSQSPPPPSSSAATATTADAGQRQTMLGNTDGASARELESATATATAAAAAAANGRLERQAQQQASLVVGRDQEQQQQREQRAKRVSLSQSDLQPQQQQQQLARQYHDNNNNNNNNNNSSNGNNCNNNNGSSKVRLLISPATTPIASPLQQTPTQTMTAGGKALTPTKQNYEANSKQQPKMVRSATATFATINSLPEQPEQQQQFRSQSARQQQQQRQPAQSRQRNYHHYDYYTDSDLASSSLLAGQPPAARSNSSGNANYQNGSHYDENLLLFATEHNTNYNQRITNGDREQRSQSQVSAQPAPTSSVGCGGGGSSKNLSGGLLATGKFVSSYPSWRQTQSPATGHQQNYSFHVPLPSQQNYYHYHHHHHQQQPASQQQQQAANLRFAATGGRQFNSSLRSRTIGHLPGMVKVGAEESRAAGGRAASYTTTKKESRASLSALTSSPGARERAHGVRQFNDPSPIGAAQSQRFEGSANYEDFYERPSIGSMKEHLIMSEGDLLRAQAAPFSKDYGCDNPFKPGTELSWEADMMVRLMKRGYPVKELPVLVETAKQVAREIGSPTHSQVDEQSQLRLTKSGGGGGSTSALQANYNKGTINGTSNKHYQVPRKQQQQQQQLQREAQQAQAGYNGDRTFNERRQSSLDLRSRKQIWANSLSRAKSAPRVYSAQADTDSIDKLITSIENEMSDLLQHGARGGDDNEDQDDDQQRLRRRKSSGDRAAAYAVEDSDDGTSGRPASSLAIFTSGGGGGKKKTGANAKTKGKKRRAGSQEEEQQQRPEKAQQVAVKGNRKAVGSARKQQQQLRKSSSASASADQNNKADLNNQISRKHKRDFECCMIQ